MEAISWPGKPYHANNIVAGSFLHVGHDFLQKCTLSDTNVRMTTVSQASNEMYVESFYLRKLWSHLLQA